MKTLWTSLALVAVLHMLAAIGFISWLAGTGRLSKERLQETKAIFALTIAQQQQAEEEEAEKQAEAEQQAEQSSRLAGETGGGELPQSRIDSERNTYTLRELELAKQQREIDALRETLMRGQQQLEQEAAELARQRREFQKAQEQWIAQRNDEGFKKAVQLYEQLKAEQVKKMFVALMQQGQTDQVVAYLERMQPRKAAAVLKQFDNPNDVERALQLTERLRERGSHLGDPKEQVG